MFAPNVSTQFATVGGDRLAYRCLGKLGIPLIFLTHFRGTMDLVDPLLINSIAETRQVILLDNAGVGHDDGTIQSTLYESGSAVVDFLATIGVLKVEILGFSMGGMIAQSIVVNHPKAANKLVLTGTQSSYSEGMISADPQIFEIAGGVSPTEEDMLQLFFYPSNISRALGHAWWERTQERNVSGEERTAFANQAGAQLQIEASANFSPDLGFSDQLKKVDMPILITNGIGGIMTPTPNSYLMQSQLPNAQLHIHPDAGHGRLYQVPQVFAKLLELFLG